MRLKEFFIRILVILPIAVWSVFIFLMLLGIVAYLLGAKPWFYCTVYCKVGVALYILATLAVFYCQSRACFRKHKEG